VQERQFRDDLYYRLNVLECVLPPLRERGEDVALLARHLLDRYVARYQAGQRHFSPSALERLARHHWPGNVRELESVIQRAVLLSPGPGIEADQLDLPAEFATTGECEQSFEAARACAIERFERSFITEILSAHRGNISHAARSAQTDRRTLQRLLRKHGIDRQIFAV
jgi:DNA-binding NtrC family response regulator